MLERIVARVVDPVGLALALERNIERGNSEMINEAGKIRARAQRLDRKVLVSLCGDLGISFSLLAGVGFERLDLHLRAQPLSDRSTGLRIDYVARHLIHQMPELRAAADAQQTPSVGVGIDVEHGLFLELVGVSLGPFGRAEEHRFFGVPARIDYRATRPPPLLDEP